MRVCPWFFDTYTVTQASTIALDEWVQVAGSFTNGQLTLAVAAEQVTTPVAGTLAYAITGSDLILGGGYQGLMNSLKWFNLASSPLTTFANGAEATSVTVGATGVASVAVQSQGLMQSFASQLPMQSIAVNAGNSRQTIELISTSTFEALAGAALSAGLVAGAPAFDLAALNNPNAQQGNSVLAMFQSPALFPTAQAYDIGFFDVISIVSSLIGLDSLKVIWDQVGNMLTGEEVDIVAFSVAILDVLSLFPPAAPLKIITVPAKVAIKLMKLGNAKSVKYLGGVLKKMFQKAKGRDFTLVYQGIAFFIIMADMALDEEARAGITEVAKMINSTDDFLDIMDFFALADDEILAPEVALIQPSTTSFFAGAHSLFPDAQAKVLANVGVKIGKAFVELAPDIAKMGKEAPKALGEIGRTVKGLNKKHITDIAFEKGFIRGTFSYALKVGVSNIKKLFSSKHRMGPVTLVAIIAYLETELEADRLFGGLAEYDKKHNIAELRKLYVTSIPAIAAGERSYGNFVAKAHGAQFQLLQIAILHAQHQGGLANARVVGIEVPRFIALFKQENDLNDATRFFDYDPAKVLDFKREIDIVTGAMNTGEIWREMKSYKAKSKTNLVLSSSISPWAWGKRAKRANDESNDQGTKGSTPHRQYILDRVANETFARMDENERIAKGGLEREFNVSVDEIYWHFHDFKTLNTQSPQVANIVKSFDKEATGAPSFYKDHVTAHRASTFVMGTVDLFLTNSQSALADAVKEELKQKAGEVLDGE